MLYPAFPLPRFFPKHVPSPFFKPHLHFVRLPPQRVILYVFLIASASKHNPLHDLMNSCLGAWYLVVSGCQHGVCCGLASKACMSVQASVIYQGRNVSACCCTWLRGT